MSEVTGWYAVRTRYKCEKKVSSLLSEKGIDHYLPTFQETHQWKDRKKIVEVPVFAGYLFIHMADMPESRLAVLRSDGVISILGQGHAIEAIPRQEIEAVRQFLKLSMRYSVHPLLKVGAWVRMKRGPFKGIEGLLVRMKNQTRLVVSISLLSQSVATEVDANDVQLLRPSGQGEQLPRHASFRKEPSPAQPEHSQLDFSDTRFSAATA